MWLSCNGDEHKDLNGIEEGDVLYVHDIRRARRQAAHGGLASPTAVRESSRARALPPPSCSSAPRTARPAIPNVRPLVPLRESDACSLKLPALSPRGGSEAKADECGGPSAADPTRERKTAQLRARHQEEGGRPHEQSPQLAAAQEEAAEEVQLVAPSVPLILSARLQVRYTNTRSEDSSRAIFTGIRETIREGSISTPPARPPARVMPFYPTPPQPLVPSDAGRSSSTPPMRAGARVPYLFRGLHVQGRGGGSLAGMLAAGQQA